MSEIAYGLHGVAYLDVLGFTARINDVRRLQGLAKAMHSLETALSGLSAKKANVHIFSDTIVVTFPDPSQILAYGITYLSLMQVVSAMMGLFLRGGIAHGDHYEEGSIMFGNAYLDAYRLEKLAVWPRMLLHPSVLRLWSGNLGWASRTVRDEMGLTFVDYLHNAFIDLVAFKWIMEYVAPVDIVMPISARALLPAHRVAILAATKECRNDLKDDLSVLTKYHGLAAYHNSVIRRLTNVLGGWLSETNNSLDNDPHFHHLYSMFMRRLAPKSEGEKEDAAKYLVTKFAELAEERERLHGAIIELPATFPELYPANGSNS